MTVSLSWWPGYSGNNICLGKIANFDPSVSPPFVLKINDEPGDFYGIQYDAVLKYAQADHDTYPNYRLPDTTPEEPAHNDTVVIQRRGRGRCRGRKRCRQVRVQPPSPLPMLTSWANSNVSNDNDDGALSSPNMFARTVLRYSRPALSGESWWGWNR